MPIDFREKTNEGYTLTNTECFFFSQISSTCDCGAHGQLDDEEGLPEKLVIKNQQFGQVCDPDRLLLVVCLFILKEACNGLCKRGLCCMCSVAAIVLALGRNVVFSWENLGQSFSN